MAGCAAPRHARDLRRGRSKANGGPQAARSAARPDQARHGPSATPCRMYEREALRARSCGKIPLRATVAGRALRGAASPARACGPPKDPTARAANHAAPRASARFARRPRQRTALGCPLPVFARRKTKARRDFPPGFVLLLWSWLRLGLAALQEQRETREGQRGRGRLGDGGPSIVGLRAENK